MRSLHDLSVPDYDDDDDDDDDDYDAMMMMMMFSSGSLCLSCGFINVGVQNDKSLHI